MSYWGVLEKYRSLSANSNFVLETVFDKIYDNTKVKHTVLNFKHLLDELTPYEKNKLVSAFIEKSDDIDGLYTLIPLVSAGPIHQSKIRKFNNSLSIKQRLLYAYRLFIDYCCKSSEKIILKSHPHFDISNDIEKTFPNVMSLPGYLPFEFLPLIKNLRITRIINIGSSSTKFINNSDETLYVSRGYFNYYSEMNLINLSLCLSGYIFGNSTNVYCSIDGWNNELS